MALNPIDRLLTVVVTATVTSAAWIVIGGFDIGRQVPGAAGVGAKPTLAADSSAVVRELTAAEPQERADTLLIPVAGIRADRLTDTFSDARSGGRVHDAIDIMAPAGTPVLAAAPGTIEKLFLSEAGGNTIYVRSTNRRRIYFYAHLREYASGLEEGARVARGQRLGAVGSTGNANPAAPHLHFAILRTTPEAKWWEPTTAIDPYPLLHGAAGEDVEKAAGIHS